MSRYFLHGISMAFPASAISSPTSLVVSYRSYLSSDYSSRPLSSISYTSQQHSYSCSCRHIPSCFRVSYRSFDAEEGEDEAEDCTFDKAVVLFNTRDYYKCHDFLESLWNKAEEPTRTLFHGILQCAVGFHHLFNKNHKGAMMELGEGLCKLRKTNFKAGPFYEFEQQISATLDFIYQTQIELAACGDDVCVAMDRSDRSYQLLGQYAAGQQLYTLQQAVEDAETMYIVFRSQRSYGGEPLTVKLPTLDATTEHLSSHGL